MKTLQWSPALSLFQQRLLGIHFGLFQENDYLFSWCTPATATLLIEHAVEMQPQRIRYGVGRPLDCHRNALEHATMNEGRTAWFGFSLSLGCWWLHSWVLEEDGTVLDSGPTTTPARYVGIPWALELCEAIAKRPDASLPLGLPPVLARSMFSYL